MGTACAVPLQKTHSIAFETKRLCYPWHRWYDRNVLTRAAGGARSDVMYFCKLPDAPLDAMLVEIPRWMFDPTQCSGMAVADAPHVDCETLHALKNTTEQHVSVKVTVLQPQLSRQPGDGGTIGNHSQTICSDAAHVIRRARRRTGLARSRGAHRGGRDQTDHATADQHSHEQSPLRGERE